ncbi:hypothetical protein ACKI10_06895 [Streptomyces galilaeus]|uniref:hypothetical protein n=1 Tax=Streptomyces galilaeus TaxID=33899 RepID=UPI0038F621A9
MLQASNGAQKGTDMATHGRPNNGIHHMPGLGTSVHEDVAKAFKIRAAEQGVSVRALLRDLLYEYAREEFDVNIETPPATTAVLK